MKDYLDSTWAAIDDTLLHYCGTDAVVQVPARMAGLEIRAIGRGAMMECGNMLQVTLPRSVRRIAGQAFLGNGKLRNVYLPGALETIEASAFQKCGGIINLTVYDLALSASQYENLKLSCAPALGAVRVARFFPEIGKLRDIVTAAEYKPAKRVPEGIERLFVSQALPEDQGRKGMTRNLDRFEFGGHAGRLTEEEAFQELIASDESRLPEDRNSEAQNDAFVRLERFPTIDRTAVFTFDDRMTKAEGETRLITANIKIGYHFWQSKVPLRYGEKEYFIYRRHYLSAAADLDYIRRDTAVFTRDGLVTDQREAQEVYAKYKLLSLL